MMTNATQNTQHVVPSGVRAVRAEKRDTDVLIVGAGPTGLTLACELLRIGVGCRVVDKAEKPSESSRATDIHSRTLELLHRLDAASPLVEKGRTVRAFNAFAGGRVVSRLDFEALKSPFPFTVAVPQRDTEEILTQRFRAAGGEIERSTRVDSVSILPNGATVTLESKGKTERVNCQYVVGCDGVHSEVRKAVGIEFEGVTYPERYAVADVDLAWPLANNEVHLFMTPDGFFNAVALPGGPRRGRVLCDLPLNTSGEPPFEMVESLFHKRTGGIGTMEAPTFVSAFRIHRRLAKHFRKGPVLLAGDAAHACSPLLGQGMNLGIQDAFNLAWKLALACRRLASESLLDSYELERRPVARATLYQTDFIHRVSRVSNGIVTRARNAAVSLLSRFEVSRNHAAMTCSALGVAYRTSPVVGTQNFLKLPLTFIDHGFSRVRRPGAPTAGERAPDMEVAPKRPLLSAESGHHTALLFLSMLPIQKEQRLISELVRLAKLAPAPVNVRVVTRTLPPSQDPLFVHDLRGQIHQAYGANKPTLFVVRPDTYVAGVAEPPDETLITRCLERVVGAKAGAK
ncbi:MAG: FAD-dependent monooxygenase [Polyangiaceae bacterium]|nr:FAD-dependent monooxygenase [Polyangiaceae bacterium]